MDKKISDKKSGNYGRLSTDEGIKLFGYWGCMGAIVFVTFLIRWLVGIFKGF
jgi:hypothetical protein